MLRKNINNRIRYILYYFIIDTRNKFDDEIFKSLFINYTHSIDNLNFQDTVVPEKQDIFKNHIQRLKRFKDQSYKESNMTSKYLEKVEEFNRLGTFKLLLPENGKTQRYDFITPYLDEKIDMLKRYEQYNKNGYGCDYLSQEIGKFVFALNQYTLGVKNEFTV